MSGWEGSTRRARLPPEWARLRERILERDGYRCHCGAPASDVDHIVPGDDHSEANLRSVCSLHHRRKSAQEGNRARRRRYDPKRKASEHPGLIPPGG